MYYRGNKQNKKQAQSSKLIRFLEDRINKKVNYKNIKALLAPANSKPASLSEDQIAKILKGLVEFDLIKTKGNIIKPNKKFYLNGKISLTPRKIGFVSVTGVTKDIPDIMIASRFLNGALSQDKVLIRIVEYSNDRFFGQVIKVTERFRQEYRLRILEESKRRQGQLGLLLDIHPNMLHAYLEPIIQLKHHTPSRRSGLTMKKSKIRTASSVIKDFKKDSVVIVSLDGSEVNYDGKFVYKAKFLRIEKEKARDLDLSRILMKYNLNINYPDFNNVINTLENKITSPVKKPQLDHSKKPDLEPTKNNISDWNKRKDFTNLYTITIDGEHSKDFDDAISLEIISDTKALLYVHIADVSYYVTPKSQLDLEAQRRGTSYYLGDTVIPMLPAYLSENLCSLVANKNRLSLSAKIKINFKTGEILKYNFYRSVIKVNRRFTYEEAEKRIDQAKNKPLTNLKASSKNDPEMKSDACEIAFLGALWELSKKKKERRMRQGRIDLELPEIKYQFTQKGQIKNIKIKRRLKSSILIEECMLSANTSTANFLKRKKVPLLYRFHETIDAKKLKQLNLFCTACAMPVFLKDASYKSITKALNTVINNNNYNNAANNISNKKVFMHLFQISLLRSFSQAYYTPHKIGHWGLGFSAYCHFTSPIRRYPDLVVHRMLIATLEKKKPFYNIEQLDSLGQKNSDAERKAVDAERDTSKLKIIRYLLETGIKTLSGFISNIQAERIYIEISTLPTETIVEARHLNKGKILEVKNFGAYLECLGRFVFPGEEWNLKIEKIDIDNLQIFCRPLFIKS